MLAALYYARALSSRASTFNLVRVHVLVCEVSVVVLTDGRNLYTDSLTYEVRIGQPNGRERFLAMRDYGSLALIVCCEARVYFRHAQAVANFGLTVPKQGMHGLSEGRHFSQRYHGAPEVKMRSFIMT